MTLLIFVMVKEESIFCQCLDNKESFFLKKTTTKHTALCEESLKMIK